jgi:spore maturation protein CgeB
MKILVVGCTKAHSYETACTREFQRLGCDVLQLDNKPERWWLSSKSWWRLTPPERAVQDTLASFELYKTARRWKPDIIFMCKAENIRAEVFTLLKRDLGCRLAIWYVDNPFNATVSSYQVLRAIQKSDFYFIWAKYLVDPLISAGASKVEFLPFGYDSEGYDRFVTTEGSLDHHWNSEVCFVGTWDSEREKALTQLAGRDFDLAIYGQGWISNLGASSPLRRHVRADAIWSKDVVKAFKGATIVLNLLRRHNWKGHNLRTMEVTGIGGGVLLTPWTTDQAEILFEMDKELLCYEGKIPAPEIINRLLVDRQLLRQISIRGQNRVRREHLLKHRIRQIIETVSR